MALEWRVAAVPLTVLLQHRLPRMTDPAEAALAAAGFEVHLSSDGVEGLSRLIMLRPDVIITGISMPQLDGFGFIEAVRRLDYLRAVPILVMSASKSGELKTRARNIGASGWLPYPIDSQQLIETVMTVAVR
ncbi:response regulator [Paracoccus lutimaris]|uniref:Two-component system chemotaxis response regulator CheY n=1 Tax=Paracoccus lutimaris TaxID=1490030 RepID=A0A368YIY9_9RHOB|nr:response regulator [Paracoccus lutimaris]RCW79276.1 two-component system chemotaxis response regulator CheY [Paracoccus lutimaris]